MAHVLNCSIWETEAGGCEYEASLHYIPSFVSNKQTNKPTATTTLHQRMKELDKEKQCFSWFSVSPHAYTLNEHMMYFLCVSLRSGIEGR